MPKKITDPLNSRFTGDTHWDSKINRALKAIEVCLENVQIVEAAYIKAETFFKERYSDLKLKALSILAAIIKCSHELFKERDFAESLKEAEILLA